MNDPAGSTHFKHLNQSGHDQQNSGPSSRACRLSQLIATATPSVAAARAHRDGLDVARKCSA